MDSILSSIPRSQAVIQDASWRDLNSLRNLERVCFPKDAWPLWDLIGVLSLPNIVRLKAMDQVSMVGFIAADIRLHEHMAWIATVGVLPEYRGRGIGTALLQACERRLGVPKVRLNVRLSNQVAIRLYHRLLYHEVGTWPGYYTDGESALVLEKRLD